VVELLRRPSARAAGSPSGGLLRNDFFELCHVTNDIAQAQKIYREQLGITKFKPLEGRLPEGGHIHVELAGVGGVMYELLTASGPGSEAFMEVLPPSNALALQFHHFGYFIHDDAAWAVLDDEIAKCGGKVRAGNDIPGFMKFRIVQVPWLGHFLEYIYPEPAAIAFFESVPNN
jgi:hypothetical protein